MKPLLLECQLFKNQACLRYKPNHYICTVPYFGIIIAIGVYHNTEEEILQYKSTPSFYNEGISPQSTDKKCQVMLTGMTVLRLFETSTLIGK